MDERIDTMYQCIVWGQSIVDVFPRAKRLVPGWEDWWARVEPVLKSDPLLRFFEDIRDDAIHELKFVRMTTNAISIGYMNIPRSIPPPPSGLPGSGFYIAGDGRWIWRTDLGEEEVEPPQEAGMKYYMSVEESPREHLGTKLWGTPEQPHPPPFTELIAVYLQWLEDRLDEAEEFCR